MRSIFFLGETIFVFVVFGEARDRTCESWFTGQVTSPLHHGDDLRCVDGIEFTIVFSAKQDVGLGINLFLITPKTGRSQYH